MQGLEQLEYNIDECRLSTWGDVIQWMSFQIISRCTLFMPSYLLTWTTGYERSALFDSNTYRLNESPTWLNTKPINVGLQRLSDVHRGLKIYADESFRKMMNYMNHLLMDRIKIVFLKIYILNCGTEWKSLFWKYVL